MNILMIALLFCAELFLFFSAGMLLSRICKLHLDSVTLLLFSGFITFFCIFGIIAIPMILLSFPLSTLTHTVIAISAAIIVCALILNYKEYPFLVKNLHHSLKQHSFMLFLLILAVGAQQLLIFNHIDWSADASYYIGKVTTDVYTNTMGHYDPYTGAALSELDSRRIFACFQEYNAVIAQFFDIHPLKQAKLIMPQLLSLITCILYYQIGLQFFHDNKKHADLFVSFVILLDIFSYTIFTNATFLLTRTYEGKSILANIIIPGLLLGFLLLWQKKQVRFTRILLLFTSFASCIFTASSMMIVPVGLTAGMIPWIIKEKEWKELIFYLFCILPNLFVCVMYLLSIKGYVSFPIGG